MSYCLDYPANHANGYVAIASDSGSSLDDVTKMFTILRKSLKYNEALPFVTKANHILMGNPVMQAAVQGLSSLFSHHQRIRMRFHSGKQNSPRDTLDVQKVLCFSLCAAFRFFD